MSTDALMDNTNLLDLKMNALDFKCIFELLLFQIFHFGFLFCSVLWVRQPRHTNRLCYRGFEGLESEVEFLKYILRHARVLKTITIQVSGKELKGNVLEKLSMFPRCSTCLLTVEWGIFVHVTWQQIPKAMLQIFSIYYWPSVGAKLLFVNEFVMFCCLNWLMERGSITPFFLNFSQ